MPVRTWKIKIKDPELIRPVFERWFNDYKYAYNKTISIMNESTCCYSKFDLRNLIVPEEVCSRIPWHLETPKDIRAGAVFEAKKNMKAAFTNLKNNNITHFTMGFLKKKYKKSSQCFSIPGSAFKISQDGRGAKIYSNYTNNFVFRFSEKIADEHINDNKSLKMEHKIYFNGFDYYLLLCFDKQICNTNVARYKKIALDLGVRKMITTWDPSQRSFIFGNRKTNQIKDLLLKKSMYQSKNNWRAMNSIEVKIKTLVKQLHHHASTFICKRYNTVIVPKLDVKNLTQKKYSRDYNKAMLRLSLCEFIELLKTKGEIYNTRILSQEDGVHEKFSSRMCSSCKFICPKTANEWKNCKNCGLEVDRDVNAAKNIYYINNHL